VRIGTELIRTVFDGPAASSMKAAAVAQGRKSSGNCRSCEDRPGEAGREGTHLSAAAFTGRAKKRQPANFRLRAVLMVPAITYFRTFQHYHRPEKLNDRVRNGNVCFLLGKVTGERAERRRPAHPSCCIKKVAVKRNCNRLSDFRRTARQAHSSMELGNKTSSFETINKALISVISCESTDSTKMRREENQSGQVFAR
jgi:hypothetical protein